jgi:5,6-dimethylbenzimidazole synthase
VFADPTTRQGHGLGRHTMPQTIAYSAVMAAHSLWLIARAEGVGMGWISILDPAAVTAAIEVPAHWQLIGYFCLGYPEYPDAIPALERAGWEHRRPAEKFLIRR